jgi:hypothetical protein
MKNVFLLLLISLLTIQCNNSKQTNSEEAQEKVVENKVVGTLIGTKLASVQETKEELNMMFDFEIIESYLLDIDNDGVEDKIVVEKIKDWNDPGDFHRIRIVTNSGTHEFFNRYGWVDIGNSQVQYVKDVYASNIIESKYLLIQKVNSNELLLFAFGYVYASKAGILSIVNLSSKDKPVLIFNDNYNLYALKDRSGDGNKEIIVTKYDKGELADIENPLENYDFIDGWLHLATN